MSWKNYFFFQKKDRIAILILLSLIVISGGIYFVTSGKSKTITNDNEKLKKEFEEFQAGLQATDTTSFSENQIYKNQSYKEEYPKYAPQKKFSDGESLELNSADTTELKKIPGIGSGYANRIIKYKNMLGGYVEITQLKEVWGMDDILYNKITPYITLKPAVTKIKVNAVDFKTLNQHPYVNYKQAQIIIDIRERKGNIESINRLALLDEFKPNDIKRLTPYLSFD